MTGVVSLNKAIAKKAQGLNLLLAPLLKASDEDKLHLIIFLAKKLSDPDVAERVLYASSVLNRKGISLRAEAKSTFEERDFGMLPAFVQVR